MTITPSHLRAPRARRLPRPALRGGAGALVCAVVMGALVTTHALPAGASATTVTTADLLSIDHVGGGYFGGTGGVVLHHTPGGDIADDLPRAVNVNAVEDVGRDASGVSDEVYAAGDHGALFYQDGGAWCQIILPAAAYQENLHAIASAGPGSVVVAGTDGLILQLEGGAGCSSTFVIDYRVPGSEALNAVRVLADGLVVAVGDGGTMLLGHADSALHHLVFSPIVSGTVNALDGVAPSVDGVVAVGAGGVVLDGKVSIDPSTLLPTLLATLRSGIPTTQRLRDVMGTLSTDGTHVIDVTVGDAGTILQSLDGGVSWTASASGTVATLDGVFVDGSGAGVAVGTGGTVVQLSLSAGSGSTTSTSTGAGGSGTGSTTSTSTGAGGSGSGSTTGTSTGAGGSGSGSTTSTSTSAGGSGSGSTTSTGTNSSSTGTGTGNGGGSTSQSSTVTSTETRTVTSTATTEVTTVSTSTTTVHSGGGGDNDGGGSGSGSGSTPAPGTVPWAKRLVDEIYLDVLGRNADPGGESYWIDQVLQNGQGPVQIAGAFLGSVEYRTNLVESMYQQYLYRSGDPTGVQSWVAALGNGMTDENARLSFLTSPEFWTNGGGTAQGYVDALYATVLQRAQDPSGEAYWVGSMNSGTSALAVANAFLDSPEMMDHRVAGYYLTYLGRPGDPGGIAYWAGRLAAGVRDESLALDLIGSTEFLSKI